MTTKKYDLFISFAYEDKAFVDYLTGELEKQEIKVWVSAQLKIGDSIFDKVSQSIEEAEYGLVVFSPNYFEKHWAMSELKALFAIQQREKKTKILPIRYQISADEIAKKTLLLADLYSLPTDDIGVLLTKITSFIHQEVRPVAPVKPFFQTPISCYVSYTPIDEKQALELIKSLKRLTATGKISFCSRDDVPVGFHQGKAMEKMRSESQLFLLLASANYLSDEKLEEEHAILVDKNQQEGHKSIVVSLSDCLLDYSSMKDLERWPKQHGIHQSIENWESTQKAYEAVLKSVEKLI